MHLWQRPCSQRRRHVCKRVCATFSFVSQVHRVTRIHNRFLRNRFDKSVSDLLACNPELAAEIAARDGEAGVPFFMLAPWPYVICCAKSHAPAPASASLLRPLGFPPCGCGSASQTGQ